MLFSVGDLFKHLNTKFAALPQIEQNKPMGFLRAIIDNNRNSDVIANILQETVDGNSIIAIKRSTVDCTDGECQTDICNLQGAPVQPAQVEMLDTSNFNEVCTKPFSVSINNFSAWATAVVMPSTAAAKNQIFAEIIAKMSQSIKQAHGKIERTILQQLTNAQGCYPDGSIAPKTILPFLGGTNGGMIQVNPTMLVSEEVAMTAIGIDSDASNYIGIGTSVIEQAKRALSVNGFNSSTGINQGGNASQLRNIYYSKALEDTFGGQQKLVLMHPAANLFLFYSKTLAAMRMFSNSEAITLQRLVANPALAQQFASFYQKKISEGTNGIFKAPLYDPYLDAYWDLYINYTACDSTLTFQAKIKYKWLPQNLSSQLCGTCYSGIAIYDLCGLPDPAPCQVTTPPVQVTPLCITSNFDPTCAVTLKQGTVVQLEQGSVILSAVVPMDITIADQMSFSGLLTQMFAGSGYGNIAIKCGVPNYIPSPNGTALTTFVAGNATLTGLCITTPITVTFGACEPCGNAPIGAKQGKTVKAKTPAIDGLVNP
jgi:hypothetical protein